MIGVDFRLSPDHAGDSNQLAAKLTPLELAALISEIGETGRSNIAGRTPVGWSGQLRGGYGFTLERRGSKKPRGVIFNATQYHDAVEEGRKPGRRPPVDALVPWVGSKLGIPPGPDRRAVAFLIARKIGAQGTPPAHMVADGWAETRKDIKPKLKAVGLKLVKVAEK